MDYVLFVEGNHTTISLCFRIWEIGAYRCLPHMEKHKWQNDSSSTFIKNEKNGKICCQITCNKSNSQKHMGEFSKSKINGYEITH